MQNVASILLELAAIFNAPTPPMAQMESFSFANELPSCVLQRYDWSSHVTMPSAIGKTELEPDSPRGSQVIRFHTANHYYRDNHRAVNFVCTFMPNAISLATDSHILLYASLLALANFPDGVAIELGSGAFKATNLIAAVFAQNTVFTCDTFNGTPTAYRIGEITIPLGTFAPKEGISDRQPPFPVLDNVVVLRGLFSQTVPQLVPLLQDTSVALIHVNGGTYESAVDGLRPLLPLLKAGTVLLFDGFYNYPNCEKGEYRAFMELIFGNGFRFQAMAYNAYHNQVVIQIGKLPENFP